ncbi:uncharacterized protein LOC124194013 isoform X2 [Daphnia pulex]|uniref:uncharacterized protein LOC124194013 isoform X2 n=1 Tax=Daphnia pulex TaxID=6669 RepID=UPI001EDED12A|nr:uncharacterized protein LOC124194013 isoform X2 [Daphnia pulex]
MMRLSRIHLFVFFVYLWVYCPVNGISNIFKGLPPLFDLSLSNNDTSVNVTVHQDAKEICIPPLLLHGSVDPVKSQYKSQDVIRIICKDGYELENPQSSLLYCSQKGLWKVFTLGDSIYIPLPRCIVKERCPPLPPLMQGSMQVQEGGVNAVTSELSSTRAVYQCWFGLELDPPESEIRYCVRGKWTGENPLCVPASCPRPPSVTGGFFIARGVVNHIYVSGAAVKYYCDEGHHQKGPPLLTCSGKEWIPKDLPACVPIESSAAAAASSSKLEVRGCSLPPEIANGRYQILPMRRSFSSSSFSPLSSRIQHWNNLQMSNNGSSTPTTSPMVVVPVYSSALYSCYRGFLSGGSSLISCSPGGWWQPTHNAPRCLPFGSSSSASSGGIHHSHGGGGGLEMTKAGRGGDADGGEGDDKVDGEEQAPRPLLVSFTTACGVTFVLCLIWMASRWKITCLRSSAGHHGRQEEETLSFSGPVCPPMAPSAASASSSDGGVGGGRRHRHQSLWTWISPNQNDRDGHHVHQQLDMDDDDSLPAYDRQLLDLGQASDQDRVALIAYMNDNNTSSQATLPSYEEAVRASSNGGINNNSTAATTSIPSVHCTWPVAPPSYESILILDETNGNGTAASTTTTTTTTSHHIQPGASPSVEANVSFNESDEAAADSTIGTTTSSEDDNDDEEDAVDGSREMLVLLVPSATLDADAITTFPARR